MSCSQDLVANVYHRCFQPDAGAGGAGGGDGGGVDMTMRECSLDRECPPDRPTCAANGMCGPCVPGSSVCATSQPSTPVCGATGACVECVMNSDCTSLAKPVCDQQSFACTKCGSDADCVGRPGPGICMAHQDGRCASEAETIYVQQTAACSTVADPAGGTSAAPFCGLDKAAVALSPTRRLIVVRGTVQGTAWTLQGMAGDPQVSIIGQQSAVIAGGASPGVRVVDTDAFIRDLTVRRSEQIGISATGGSTLHLENVIVVDNGGGGVFVDASAFNIVNTLVMGNGPGTLGTVTWGGMLLQNFPVGGTARLERVTVQGNNGPGVSCSGAVDGLGVLATANSPVDLSPSCSLTSCGSASATCGAM